MSQYKTLSALSLLPPVQVLQTVARSFIKFIHCVLNNFQSNWKENLFRVQRIDISESQYSLRVFINDLIDSNQVMQSTWQTGVANARLEFSGEVRFQILSQK